MSKIQNLKTFTYQPIEAPESSKYHTGKRWFIDGNIKQYPDRTILTTVRVYGDAGYNDSGNTSKEFRAACEAFKESIKWGNK